MIQKIIWVRTRHESRQKNKDPSIFLANFWNLPLRSENLELFFPQKIWQICVIFFIKNLCTGPNHIVQVEIWQNFTQNKHWVGGWVCACGD